MSFMEYTITPPSSVTVQHREPPSQARQALVLVIEDRKALSDALQGLCDYLSIRLDRADSERDIAKLLREQRPMAVIADFDCRGQDGCRLLMTVAEYDRRLPVLLLTGGDAALAGAAEAVEQIWGLTAVVKWPEIGSPGSVVEFLIDAGRAGGCLRLLP